MKQAWDVLRSWRGRLGRAALALALATLGLGGAPAGQAQEADKVGPGVRAAVRAGGAAVVVTLAEPAAVAQAATDLARVRAGVSAAQAAVLGAVGPADFQLRVRFQAVPALAGMVLSEAGLDALAAHPGVTRIDLDLGGGGHLNESVPLIGANQWHAQGVTGAGVVVAVLDTGITAGHPDLAGALIHEACFLDFDGLINGVGQCPNGSDRQFGAGAAVDGAGHGTHVSGIVTSDGVVASVGVAPGASIVAVKVLNNSSFAGSFQFFSEITAALDYILNNRPDVQVINMSLGTFATFAGDCDASLPSAAAVINLLRANGVIVFASSGNSGSGTTMTAPACLSGVVSVGATDGGDNVAAFSNSNASTDLMAPGVGIISDAIGGGTVSATGTSMASPHAAGCAALLIAAGEATAPAAIEAWLAASPVTVTDTKNSLAFPRLDCTPPPRPPESVSLGGLPVGFAGVPALVPALVAPLTTTKPLTFTWGADDHAPIVHGGVFTVTDSAAFTWPLTGTRTITVTALNALGAVTATKTITVVEGMPVYLPAMLK
jgi:subtilisin family serine protease